MYKVTAKVDGMMCNMCEAHVSDAIRNTFPGAKKVSASHKKGEAVFLSEDKPSEEEIKKVITDTGYTCTSVTCKDYVKKGLFGKI